MYMTLVGIPSGWVELFAEVHRLLSSVFVSGVCLLPAGWTRHYGRRANGCVFGKLVGSPVEVCVGLTWLLLDQIDGRSPLSTSRSVIDLKPVYMGRFD
jgi:hypothetical protein